MRKLMGVLGALAAATLAGTALPAQASTYLGIENYRAVGTNLCISDLSEGLGIASCPANPPNYQKWGVYAAPNVRAFKNVSTGRCIQGGWDARVVSVVCQGSDYQRFNILHYSDGSIAFRNVAVGSCINYELGRPLKLVQCNGSVSQRFH
ncbi:RICIN domain-containing protein [Kribbella sp. NPDC051952]|uniref:RICIN domain-containing protein n=1 Tax=Kribbella sp. NPDC051952 TaxID=3154851 RepID=UPI003430998F